MTLGQVVKTLYDQRQAMWTTRQEHSSSEHGPTERTGKRARNEETDIPNGWSTHLRDGREVCIDWNLGKCSEPCPQDKFHGCAKNIKNRVCGMKHRAGVGKGCTNKR